MQWKLHGCQGTDSSVRSCFRSGGRGAVAAGAATLVWAAGREVASTVGHLCECGRCRRCGAAGALGRGSWCSRHRRTRGAGGASCSASASMDLAKVVDLLRRPGSGKVRQESRLAVVRASCRRKRWRRAWGGWEHAGRRWGPCGRPVGQGRLRRRAAASAERARSWFGTWGRGDRGARRRRGCGCRFCAAGCRRGRRKEGRGRQLSEDVAADDGRRCGSTGRR